MPVANPLEYTYTAAETNSSGSTSKSIPHPPPVSKVEHVVAGLKTITYGLAELSGTVQDVTCLWMLHPRLQIQECMAPFAAQFIKSWNEHPQSKHKGLIAVSFDQRNHGTREVSSIANEAWRSGNEKHAQDMFSCYHGTSTDTSQLLDHIEAYIFPEAADKRKITQNTVFGISLGGHAAWHVMIQDPRFSAAIITIGCPDYTRLMTDRARLSKRKTWTDTEGKDFVGSVDFPSGLVEAVGKHDPAGLLLGPNGSGEVLEKTLGKRRVINLSGGSDKLVPYAMGKGFLDWLKSKAKDIDLHLEDVVVEGAGHEVPPEMVAHMERFLMQVMEGEGGADAAKRESKI